MTLIKMMFDENFEMNENNENKSVVNNNKEYAYYTNCLTISGVIYGSTIFNEVFFKGNNTKSHTKAEFMLLFTDGKYGKEMIRVVCWDYQASKLRSIIEKNGENAKITVIGSYSHIDIEQSAKNNFLKDSDFKPTVIALSVNNLYNGKKN